MRIEIEQRVGNEFASSRMPRPGQSVRCESPAQNNTFRFDSSLMLVVWFASIEDL